VLGGLVITTAGGMKWFHDHLGGTEGLYRSVAFYSVAIPKYALYRYHYYMGSPDEVWKKLDQETSQVALETMLQLEGFYYKAGQMCASNLGDAFPEVWRDTMSVLQDQVPPQPFDVIESTIRQELDFEKTFQSFDKEPIGSASIGQVHRAVLWDGTKVVVKVCYPNAERLLRGDVRTLRAFASLAQPVHVPALKEMEKQFATEFDYREEAKNMARIRQNLMESGLAGGPGTKCQVPKPYMEHTTKRVLVMEELFGEKLEVALRKDLHYHAQRAHQSVDQFLLAQKMEEEQKIAKGDKIQGPSSQQYETLIALEDGKRRVQNGWNRLYNSTLGLVSSEKRPYASKREVVPLNHAQLIDDLIEIHGYEVLVHGFFNGDAHPGNILLCWDDVNDHAQLGLIDYGQVKPLTKQQRHWFAKLMIALDDDNEEEVAKLITEAGYKSQKMDPKVMNLYAKVAFDNDSREITGGQHIQLFMEQIQEMDPIYSLPKDFVMVSRCTLLLRGLAHAVKQSRTIAKAWRPIAERVLAEDI